MSSTEFLGVEFSNVDFSTVEEALRASSARSDYFYIVTPNVDHVVRIEQEQRGGTKSVLTELYRQAKFCLCDSRVLKALARMKGVHLNVICGSDLTVYVLSKIANNGDLIALVGGDNLMLVALRARYPSLTFLHHVPPMGLRHNSRAIDEAAEFVVEGGARFALLAVGSPQQEMLAARIGRCDDARGVALCIGASVDFIVGREKRAPRLLQRLGLEWSYRLAQNPQRLWRRYLIEGPRIFALAAAWRRPPTAVRNMVVPH